MVLHPTHVGTGQTTDVCSDVCSCVILRALNVLSMFRLTHIRRMFGILKALIMKGPSDLLHHIPIIYNEVSIEKVPRVSLDVSNSHISFQNRLCFLVFNFKYTFRNSIEP